VFHLLDRYHLPIHPATEEAHAIPTPSTRQRQGGEVGGWGSPDAASHIIYSLSLGLSLSPSPTLAFAGSTRSAARCAGICCGGRMLQLKAVPRPGKKG
jgi:hypothetical protein